MNAVLRDHYLDDFRRVAARLPGARVPWLERVRTTALDDFARQGFPTRRDEEWKYTSVAAFEKHAFRAGLNNAHDMSAAHAVLVHSLLDRDAAILLVFHNGHYAPALSSQGDLPAGVTLGSLSETLNARPEVLEPYFDDEDQQPAFGALNTAFMSDGAYLHLKRGTVLEQPVHLLFISTGGGGASHVRNVLVAEPGARATVIEHFAGTEGGPYFTNAVTRIFAGEGAAIEHHKLQEEATDAFHIAGIHATQQRDSRFASHAFTLGAALSRNDITTAFGASGCDATLNGLYLIGQRQHADTHTLVDHCQPNGTSRENYRGVLDGFSHAVFNGKVVVHPHAQKTNAFQSNHNLLLSRDAEIDTKPQLEIHADDVKCTHGATIGQIDAAQLFYLRSRGIEESAARGVLVHAFAHDVIEPIRVAGLRHRLEKILMSRLLNGEATKELS